jgi:hypothetical protein
MKRSRSDRLAGYNTLCCFEKKINVYEQKTQRKLKHPTNISELLHFAQKFKNLPQHHQEKLEKCIKNLKAKNITKIFYFLTGNYFPNKETLLHAFKVYKESSKTDIEIEKLKISKNIITEVKDSDMTAKSHKKSVLICGDRNYTNVMCVRDYLISIPKNTIIIVGGCSGVDKIAENEAKNLNIQVKVFNADWSKYGKSAGPIRNAEMLKENPFQIVIFHDNIKSSKGSKDMMTKGLQAGIETILFENCIRKVLRKDSNIDQAKGNTVDVSDTLHDADTSDIVDTIERTQLNETAWIDKFLLPKKHDRNFDILWNIHPEKYALIRIGGRMIETPRWQQTYGRHYTFSGMAHDPLPIPKEFQHFFNWANALVPEEQPE